ncbi:MAG: haloacid dehalogenase type II, partial [Gemmatimonadetes bacterium]|nr:haloacid dehalogenase type II [Gemmatimonadota bacterium]NIR81023.1 haloacid dehalogenase type II [Gemmatimonadota bacterium]NIT87691.1 haloacid dehalogenase type II [Gemmatimonadota bacterium]NIU33629.1 haloacid dehalogenase type II [Gemmatimonadota bacterium]NIU37883.1 haloacid dehalogenase type II [Gemmatimonadota bacterium]
MSSLDEGRDRRTPPASPAGDGPEAEGDRPAPDVEALTFDVFGTVVDWRTPIVRAATALGQRAGVEADWGEIADRWRDRYRPTLERVRSGEIPFRPLEELHRMALDEVLDEAEVEGLDAETRSELNRAWRRLEPWPDAVEGLQRLRRRYVVSTLSNGNVGLLVAIAKSAGLPWDCVLSAQMARTYKPGPEVYRTAAELLGLPAERIMMVASH